MVKLGHHGSVGTLRDRYGRSLFWIARSARYPRIILFTVRCLRLHAQHATRHSEYPPLETNGVRVLLVEDADLIGELIHDIFCEAGAIVVA